MSESGAQHRRRMVTCGYVRHAARYWELGYGTGHSDHAHSCRATEPYSGAIKAVGNVNRIAPAGNGERRENRSGIGSYDMTFAREPQEVVRSKTNSGAARRQRVGCYSTILWRDSSQVAIR